MCYQLCLKFFEKAISTQLTEFFEPIFNKFLCAFRRGYGCQTTLLRLIEDWKEALDKNMYVAAILMDLSKAFDCLPHNILLSKLAAYGLSSDSTKLLENYLTNRQQQVKIGDSLSSWSDIHKGVPQGFNFRATSFLMFSLMIYFTLLIKAPCTITLMIILYLLLLRIFANLFLS